VISLVNYKLIDTHCHIFSDEFDNDRVKVLNQAFKEGVLAIIDSSIGSKNINKTLSNIADLKTKIKSKIFLSFGLSPYELDELEYDLVFNLIEKNLNNLVSVGEVGLDYYYIREHNLRNKQVKYFRSFIELAKTNNLPLIIHSRSAGKHAIDILIKDRADKVLMHAFDGSFKSAKIGLDYNFSFSIPTSVVYSQQKKNLVKKLPVENILLETDSPVLAPIKGIRNEPKYIKHSLEELAKIKEMSIFELSELILKNTKKFFNLKLD
jgi:TatD DNase family protein